MSRASRESETLNAAKPRAQNSRTTHPRLVNSDTDAQPRRVMFLKVNGQYLLCRRIVDKDSDSSHTWTGRCWKLYGEMRSSLSLKFKLICETEEIYVYIRYWNFIYGRRRNVDRDIIVIEISIINIKRSKEDRRVLLHFFSHLR